MIILNTTYYDFKITKFIIFFKNIVFLTIDMFFKIIFIFLKQIKFLKLNFFCFLLITLRDQNQLVQPKSELDSGVFLWSPVSLWNSKLLNSIDYTFSHILYLKINFMIIIFIFCTLAVLLLAILGTALLTLNERSILGTVQVRRGPNKVIFGFLQPIADAFKLIFKEFVIPSKVYKYIYVNIASFGFVCSSSLVIFVPFSYSLVFSNNEFSFLFIFFFNLLHVYAILLSGWSSKSKYSFLGAVRSSSQLISYDIALALIIIHIFSYIKSLGLLNIIEYQDLNLFLFIVIPIQALFFLIIGAAETSRHPFDLPEAEPELVSGYNVEYSAIRFALFFLSEYLAVILFSNLVVIAFFGSWNNYVIFQSLEFIFKISFIIFLVIKLRAVLPRYRVDQLMRVCWKFIIPFELLSLILNLVCIFLNV